MVVKQYSTSREFFETNKLFYTQPQNLRWLYADIERLRGTAYDDAQSLLNVANRDGGLAIEHANMLSGPMGAYYDEEDTCRAYWRRTCLVFYALSAVFMAIPTLWTFVEIIGVAVQRLD